MNRVLVFASVFALVVGVGAAFASGSSEAGSSSHSRVTMLVWGGGPNSTNPLDITMNQAAKKYNAAHNNAIELEWIGNSGYYTKLNSEIAAGNSPDIFAVHAAGKLGDYVTAKKAIPLDKYLNADTAWKDSFFNGAFDSLTYSGQRYAIPWYFSYVMLYYNKSIFEKYGLQPPGTWANFTNAIKTLRANNVTPIEMGSGNGSAWIPAMFMEILAQRIGGLGAYKEVTARQGNWSYVNPTFIKAGEMLQELTKMGAFPSDYLGLGNSALASAFTSNEAGMYIQGSWAVGDFEKAGSQVKTDVGVVDFPAIPGGTGGTETWLGQPSENFAVSPNDKNMTDTIGFLKAVTGTEPETQLAEKAGQIPSTKITLDPSKVPAVTVASNKLLQKMQHSYIFYDVGLGTAIGNEWNNTVVAIWSGKDPKTQLEKMQSFAKSHHP